MLLPKKTIHKVFTIVDLLLRQMIRQTLEYPEVKILVNSFLCDQMGFLKVWLPSIMKAHTQWRKVKIHLMQKGSANQELLMVYMIQAIAMKHQFGVQNHQILPPWTILNCKESIQLLREGS